jgi:hypothetical protein
MRRGMSQNRRDVRVSSAVRSIRRTSRLCVVASGE